MKMAKASKKLIIFMKTESILSFVAFLGHVGVIFGSTVKSVIYLHGIRCWILFVIAGVAGIASFIKR